MPSDVLTALGNGSLSVTATVTNGHGNTGTGEREIAIDANLPGLRVDTVAGDDVVNTIEHAQNLIVSGTSDGLAPGTALTVTVNGKDYAATVLADGTWRAAIPSTDVSAWPEGTVKISVTGDSAAGNPITISHDVTVDLATVAISINALATDDVINAAEKGADLVLSGVTTNVEAGQTVTISLNGRIYTTTVDDSGNWTYTVPSADLAGLKDGDASVQVSVTNVNGNSASAGREYSVDATAPSVTINTIATDDILNASEAQSDLAISGTSTAEAGQTVTVSLNGKDYTTTVSANGSWTLNVPAADLAGLSDGSVTVTASVSDKAGNPASADHNLTVDVTVPAVTIHTVAGDDVINVAEHNQAQIISGSATGAAAGDKVTVTIGGQTYTTVLDAAGNWSVGVPANVISGLSDGTATVSVSVTDAAGNTGSGTHNVTVDTGLPSVSFNAISDDNVLNAVEKGQDLSVSGTSANLAEGTLVTVTLNGKNYTATTAADGTWSLTVPAADLTGLGQASYTLNATATNGVGNSVSNTANLLVDTALPTVTINTIAGDNVINAAEVAAGQTLSGKVANAEAGNTVTVTIGGNTYTATVQSDLTWSVNVPESVLTALGNGDLTVSATVTNGHGNMGTGERDVTIDASLPGLRVNTVAGDDVINSIEHGQNLIVSGTSDGLAAGTTLTVTVNGKTYAASVLADGSWTAAIPAADVGALAAGTMTVTVAGQSTAGNPVSISHDVTVDLAAVAISIDAIATDDVINAAEVASGQTLSGKVSGAASGDTVTISVGGNTYTTTVQDDLSWSVNVASDVLTAIGNGDLTVSASVTNGHGNTGSGERDITIDANLPGLRVDKVAGDDVINSIEHGQNLIITGSSDGLAAGSALTVTVNGKTYAATVLADGTWTAAVPAADVGALSEGTVTVTVEGQSAAGNPVSISHDVKVDLATVAISIDAIATDDVINAAEKGADLVLSGATTNVEENQTVTITFGGKTYSATVDASGNWTATVPSADLGSLKDGDASVQVSVTNVNGNSASAGREYSVDATAPTVSIEIVSDNNIINAAEAQQDLVVNGVSNAEAGQTVTVTLNGVDYTTTVQANGSWSVTVPSADIGAITDGSYTITAAVADKAGNPALADRDVLVDTTVPQLTINTVSDDDVINSAEHAQALIVTGSVTGAAAGDVVTVTINNKDYTATLDASGRWSVGVPAADVSALTAGDHTITAALTDKAGNSNSTTHEVEVNLTAPVLTIDTVSGDDVINSSEKTQDLTITGTASGLAAGAVVTVMLNGKAYSATVDTNGQWTTTVPASEVGQLGEALYTVSASATDSVGNSTSTSHTVNVESVLPGVIINAVAGDDVINAAELATGQTISGTVVNAEAGNTVTVSVGGHNYTATVQSDLTWSVSVPESVLTALGNGDLTVTASVTNGVGNSGSGERDITIDANLPGLRVDTVAGDDVINSIEHGQNLIITGSSDGLTAGTALTVTVNGKTYAATVLADGTWSAAIPSADVSALAAGAVTVNVEGQSSAGNPVTINHDVTVDLANVAISIDAIASDDVINAAERGADLVLSGTTANVEENQTVTITFGGKSYTHGGR